jgi:hypothetical protein
MEPANTETIGEDMLPPTKPTPPVEPFRVSGNGISPVPSFNSMNFQTGVSGWGLGSSGNTEFNGSRTIAGHFTPVLSMKGLSIYISDGTTPNGALTGRAGDICFGADSGKAYKCTTGTTWVSFT